MTQQFVACELLHILIWFALVVSLLRLRKILPAHPQLGIEVVFLTERGLGDAFETEIRNAVSYASGKLKLEVTPLTNESNKEPLIGLGLESVIAMTLAAAMFTLALLRPVIDHWLPF